MQSTAAVCVGFRCRSGDGTELWCSEWACVFILGVSVALALLDSGVFVKKGHLIDIPESAGAHELLVRVLARKGLETLEEGFKVCLDTTYEQLEQLEGSRLI